MSLKSNIEKHLYKMMDVLRSEARPHQSVQIILTLLLLKYFSIYDDHDFDIPDNAKWGSVKALKDDVGIGIIKALDELTYANKDLPDGKNVKFQAVGNLQNVSDSLFKDIIELIDGINFQNTIFDEISPAGKAIEYLIKYIPIKLAEKVVHIIRPRLSVNSWLT